MSKNRDYTRFSKGPVESVESVGTVATVETVAEDIVESVETAVEDIVEDIQAVEVEQEYKIEEPVYLTGVVIDCVKLNVREDPQPTATILGVVAVDTELIVIEAESTKDFYKICTSAGLEGYCMKKFVTIKP